MVPGLPKMYSTPWARSVSMKTWRPLYVASKLLRSEAGMVAATYSNRWNRIIAPSVRLTHKPTADGRSLA